MKTWLVAWLAGACVFLSGEAVAADFFLDFLDVPFRLRLNASLRLSENFVDNTWTLGMTNPEGGPLPGASHKEYSRQTGLQYEIPVELTSGDNFELFLRLQRLGRADYARVPSALELA